MIYRALKYAVIKSLKFMNKSGYKNNMKLNQKLCGCEMMNFEYTIPAKFGNQKNTRKSFFRHYFEKISMLKIEFMSFLARTI